LCIGWRNNRLYTKKKTHRHKNTKQYSNTVTAPSLQVAHNNGYHVIETRKAEKENFSLLSCYTASSGNFLPTFRDNLSGPFLKVKNPGFLTFKDIYDMIYMI
jgi:hypothetical protein